MAGYVFHITHLSWLIKYLSAETRKKLPDDFLTQMFIGAIVPDLAEKATKNITHYNVPHTEYGYDYMIPYQKLVYAKYLKKDPTKLGILAHLVYDSDHINDFLLRYAKPCTDESEILEAQQKLGIDPSTANPRESYYCNTVTGSYIDGYNLWGNWKERIGEIYLLYNKFNAEAVQYLMPMLNEEYGTEFANTKDGFLEFINYLFPDQVPITEIVDMECCRDEKKDFKEEIAGFFADDGANCKFEANIEDIFAIIKESAKKLAEKIDELYETE